MITSSFKTLLGTASVIAVSACGTLDGAIPDTFSGKAEVTPVLTEHSFGLQCLGALIDDSGVSPILVDVDRIRDRTIPSRTNDTTRLSQAGEWLIHTAISKMETASVRTTIGSTAEKPALTITGAWTQDDELLRRSGGLVGVGWIKGKLNMEGRQSYDYIAGDFVSSREGVVIYSTAIGVILGSSSVDAKLMVQNSNEFATIGFDARGADGPQLAQRRIAEAATLVHIANYFEIDYKPCLESGWANPAAFRSSLDRYNRMANPDRNRALQSNLARLGYNPGRVDGRWGEESRAALMKFQSDRRIPATGQPAAVLFALSAADQGAADAAATGRTPAKIQYVANGG